MSYGPNLQELYRRAADLVDKILRGTKPADIPVEQPTKFDLVVNLTTAKAVGPRNFTNATRPRGQGDRIAFLLHCIESGCGTKRPRANATACPQPAEADISSLDGNSRFGPTQTNRFCDRTNCASPNPTVCDCITRHRSLI